MMFGTDRSRIGKPERELMFAAQSSKCMYCGRKLGLRYLHVDHKTPVKRGGTDRVSNLQLLCQPCNSRKSDMKNGEFRKLYGVTPAAQAKKPPTKTIPQSYFDAKKKQIDAKKKNARKRQNNWSIV